MDPSLILRNFLSPPVLFFFLGALAVALRSSLTVPRGVGSFLSLYLLLVIGFNGGVELQHSGLGIDTFLAMLFALGISVTLPVLIFFGLRRKMGAANAAAVGATYGSVSAVTFITAIAFLEEQGTNYGGYMVASLALMESPAIMMSILLTRTIGEGKPLSSIRWRERLHEAFLNPSVFLLFGSLLVGLIASERGVQEFKPFTAGLFKGLLAVFLLDMGIKASKRINELRRVGWFAVGFAALFPLFMGNLVVFIAYELSLTPGDALLFSVLAASGSYIAVPAAMPEAIPEADTGLYLPMSLGITFPVNIVIGIPLYYSFIQWLFGAAP